MFMIICEASLVSVTGNKRQNATMNKFRNNKIAIHATSYERFEMTMQESLSTYFEHLFCYFYCP